MTFRFVQLLLWTFKTTWNYCFLRRVCHFKKQKTLNLSIKILLNSLFSLSIWTIQSLPLWFAWIMQVVWDLMIIIDFKKQKQIDASLFSSLVYVCTLESGWTLGFCVCWSWSFTLFEHSGNIAFAIAGMLISLVLGSTQFFVVVFGERQTSSNPGDWILLGVSLMNVVVAQCFIWSKGQISSLFCLFAGIYTVLIGILLRFFVSKNDLKNKEDAISFAEDSLKKAQDQMEENTEKLREMNHSLKDHLMILYLLNQQHENQEIERYLQPLLEDTDLRLYATYCADPVLNALFNQMTISHNQIHFDLLIDPSITSLPNLLIEALFLGADNACEELERTNALSKIVEIRLQQTQEEIQCIIRNPLSQLKTLQSDKEGDDHGIGIKRIARLITTLNGHFEIRQDRWFTLTMTIPLENKK